MPSAVFSRREGTWQNVSGGDKIQDLQAISDPVARGATVVLGEPTQFVQAADRRTGAGLWVARDTAGRVLGSSLGVFRRERGRWLLGRLEVAESDVEPTFSLNPYCHALGDIDRFQADMAALQAATEPKPSDDPLPAETNNPDAEVSPAEPHQTSQ